MTSLPAVVVSVPPGDAVGLERALGRAERLGFETVLVPVPPDGVDRARTVFAPLAARSALRIALLVVGEGDGGTAMLAEIGPVAIRPRRAPDLLTGRSPEPPAAQLLAFGRLLRDGGDRLAVWDGLDRIAPPLEAVLARGAETRSAMRSDQPPDRPYALVTGGAGFIGTNLADRLLASGEDVLVLDNLQRPGTERNLRWLRDRHGERVRFLFADLRDRSAVEHAVERAASVFHLAAQVAVTTSLADPLADFETNLAGTVTLLEAVRRLRPLSPVVFASTNKVYGDLADVALVLEAGAWRPVDRSIRSHGVGETRPLDFHTPYGCSKGAADQYVLDYARSFGLRAVVLRMSCIYGRLQLGTEDQGWVAHFLRAARAGDTLTLYGDGHQVRDILDVGDAVAAYLAARASADRLGGRAFNLGGGPDNAVSLVAVLDAIGGILNRPVERRFAPWRQGDQRYFVADTRAARAALGLAAPLPWRDGLARLNRALDDMDAPKAVPDALPRPRLGAVA